MTRTLPLLVGIDLGTSSLKTVVLDARGRLLAAAARGYPVDAPAPGWAEQDPAAWVDAALATLTQAVRESGARPEQIAAIGLAGQMHTTVVLGADGRPLRPAVTWADQRSAEQVREVTTQIGRERLAAWTGNPLAAGFMLATWLWLRRHEPEACRAARHLLLPKDYLRYRLTGALGSEPSDASSTLLFDPFHRAWSTPLLAACGIDAALLPPIGPSAGVAGGLLPEVASAVGLYAGTPVVYGGSDQATGALAQGVVTPGQVACTIGSGGQIVAPIATPAADPRLRLHLFCHALPDVWHLEAAILAAGLSLRWLSEQLFAGERFQDLADLAATAPPGAGGLYFLPYLAGERTPHMDPAASGAFLGLRLSHTKAHLVRAVMEGVVFALRQGLELIEALGGPVTEVIAAGGGTRHPLWLQLQADIFDRLVVQTETLEAAASGAALLAGVGAGAFPDARSAALATARRKPEVIAPDAERAAAYASAYREFCSFYPRLHGADASPSAVQ